MSANLYDLLNVEESASADEIRAAWKLAIADLDPTDRRFRAYNDAAGVLLDAEKRASYDAELLTARDAEQAAEAAAEQAEVETDQPKVDLAKPMVAGSSPVVSTQLDDTLAAPAADPAADPAVDAAADPAADPSPVATPTSALTRTSARSGPGPSSTALIASAVAAVLAIALVGWLVSLEGVRADSSPKDVAERSARQERAMVSAEFAAEQMVAPVLSYNHETMDADLARRTEYLTTKMADKQAKAWPEITKEAISQEIVVEASATAAALSRIDPDGERATVVVYINQRVTKKATEPFLLQMWATMSLVKAAGSDDTWLLDDLCTDSSRCG